MKMQIHLCQQAVTVKEKCSISRTTLTRAGAAADSLRKVPVLTPTAHDHPAWAAARTRKPAMQPPTEAAPAPAQPSPGPGPGPTQPQPRPLAAPVPRLPRLSPSRSPADGGWSTGFTNSHLCSCRSPRSQRGSKIFRGSLRLLSHT